MIHALVYAHCPGKATIRTCSDQTALILGYSVVLTIFNLSFRIACKYYLEVLRECRHLSSALGVVFPRNL